jgi:hypothetical protein
VERYILASNLEWTLVGLPLLTDKSAKGTYRVLEYPPERNYIRELSKADLATFLIKVAEKNLFMREKVVISD